jgi:hypothetical protein
MDPSATLPADYTFTTADAGVHTFTSQVTLRTAGSQTMTATDTAAGSISGRANVTVSSAAADHLLFLQQPSDSTAGQAISPPVKVEILDQFNNVLSNDYSDMVTVAIGNNPGGGTLSGTLSVTVVGGVATFADLSIDMPGSGYTLAANGAGLPALTSAGFTINPAAADHLVFLQQPVDTAAGQTMGAVIVEIVDRFGNVVTSDNTDTVTLSIGVDPSGGSATLGGTLTLTVTNGVATFSDLSIDLAGMGYTLRATVSGGLPGLDSNPFNIL